MERIAGGVLSSCAIAKIQMKKITKFLNQRRKNAKILSNLLSDLEIDLPIERKGEKVNWYLYTISTKNRNKILKNLNSNGIGAGAYYSTPVHRTPFYKKKLRLPVTDWASSHVLSLPVHPLVKRQNLSDISKRLHKLVRK